MKKTVVSLQNMEGWPLIGNRKVWVAPVGLPFSGVKTLSDKLEEKLKFRRYGPEEMDALRVRGRVLRPGSVGYIPTLSEGEWETVLGPLRDPVKRGFRSLSTITTWTGLTVSWSPASPVGGGTWW